MSFPAESTTPAAATVFGPEYAKAYDFLYRAKDYEAECAFLNTAFEKYGDGPIHSLLDLGCGTAGHALVMARQGFDVTGVDRSGEMLAIGAGKAEKAGIPLRLEQGDLRDFDLARNFDAAIMMFAVLGYQTGNDDVLQALRTARRHLRAGGLLVLDAWYGPAVLAQRPGQRFVVESQPDGTLIRTSDGRLDVLRHLCSVQFGLWQIAPPKGVTETCERHLMRFFFPLELELFLNLSGFALRRLGAFPDWERDPGEDTWNVTAIAQAV